MGLKKKRNSSAKDLSQVEQLQVQFRITRNQRIAITIGAIVVWGFMGGLFLYFVNKPLISTSYYHANIQFRAGDEASYDAIFLNSLDHIVDMYWRHPNWKWTLECQGLLIEMAYNNYTDIFLRMQAMNQRGQLELICPQYSHALALAYPYKDFAESIAYNKWLLEEVYDLIISRVLVLQEGQYLPAFPLLKSLGFDTFAISRDQLGYQNYFPHDPLVSYSFGGQSGYVMPLIWLPCFEAGVFHHQLVLSDSERVNTGGEGAEGEGEFIYNPKKMEQLERRHIELEKLGNIWMTMAEWVQYCIDNNQVGVMNKFMPESNWTPNRHFSMTRWMAWHSGNTPDGIMLARNYYTRNQILKAQVMLQRANASLLTNDSEYCEGKILEAQKNLWMAQVTDTTGVNPNYGEFIYGINHTRIAQDLIDEVVAFIRLKIPAWLNPIQVDCYGRQVLTASNLFQNVTLSATTPTKEQLNAKYGFEMKVSYMHESAAPHLETYATKTLTAWVNGQRRTFEYDTAYMEFTGPYHFFVNNTQPSSTIPVFAGEGDYSSDISTRSNQSIDFFDDWSVIHYSPSIAENYTVRLVRDDYTHPAMEGDPYYMVPLPICNGFVYNDNGGYAIIKNTTVNHISFRWENESAKFLEFETEYNSHYEFIFFKGSLEDAHLLATLINSYPIMEVV